MGMLPAKSYPTLCHYPSSSPSLSKRQNPNPRSLLPHIPPLGAQSLFLLENSTPRLVFGMKPTTLPLEKRRLLHTCRDSIEREDFEASVEEKEKNLVERTADGGASASDWITSVLLFGLWAGLMYYVFQLAPNQTPVGFLCSSIMLTFVCYFSHLTLFILSFSSRSKVPVWPFLVASFFVGAYALIPYFVLWKPPPPAVEEEELTNWPLNFLDSKVTAMITIIAGLGLIVYAGLADGAVWMEFYQYCRESKLIHVTVIDFLLCTAFAPFWVYNDMTARGWMNKGSWLLPIALIPLVGPALYVLLRPPLAALPMFTSSTSTKSD
ncbi:hypothetical protein ZIOFF_068687 [Zingiber officinale]|uniref:Cardiolipin synthase N-terminal domain-containing protein n=1 Tax=Zingiber officinale TaxID=94328 RepID=A0A8J5BM74_ZINOF|nr:hypothetical protein ZIOFF_068687 [Zingiber officinale]